jgi:shikimate kinase
MNDIICGFTASGKSHYGKIRAQVAQKALIDMDDLVLAEGRKQAPEIRSIRALYNHLGKEAFRALELEVLTKTCEQSTDTVIVCGGGIRIDEQGHLLKQWGKVVYVYQLLEVILARLKRQGFPAYLSQLSEEEKIQWLTESYHERVEVELSLADEVIDLSATAEDVADGE